MPTLPQDGEFGTYGERKPRIVQKSMKVGEQDVGLDGSALAKALDEAAKVSSAEVAAGEEPPASTDGPAEGNADTAPDEGQAAPAEPAQPETETEPQTTAGEEPSQPVESEPVTPATGEEATEDTVTLSRAEYDELKRGTMMQADYTRKTQGLSELRKETEKLQAEARAARDQYLSLVRQAETAVSSSEREPDWPTLRQRMTPEEYADARDLWARQQSDRAAIKAERERVEKQKAADDLAEHQKRMTAEQERLYTIMPDLRDQKTLASWLKRMHATAKAIGFADSDFDQIADHRLFLLLNQAAKGASVTKDKPVTTKPPVSRPRSVGPGATPPVRTPQNARDKSMENLKKKQSVEAAGEYFAGLDL